MAFDAYDQEKKMIFEYSPDSVFDALSEVFERNRASYKMKEADRLSKTFLAESGVGWKSWGEVLQILIVPVSNGASEVLIVSKPKFDMTVKGLKSKYDLANHDKNLKNIDDIFNRLTDELNQSKYLKIH